MVLNLEQNRNILRFGPNVVSLIEGRKNGRVAMQISEQEIENLTIDKFIFHVVHHRADEPILLDETPIAGFEDFFLARVLETLKGNGFIFADGSMTKTVLSQVLQDDAKFVPVSKLLAQNFHAGRDKRIKPGVMIFIKLITGARKLLSILKYDHEEAVTYDIKDAKAMLKAIANSFTKSADALQKSALIEIVDKADDIVVVDKTVRHEITDFFRGFLVCKRRYSESEMTQVVETVVVEVVKKHQGELPDEITQNARDRYYEAVQKREKFDAADFFSEFFGVHGAENVKETFEKLLAKKGLEGEVFKFDKAAIRKQRPQKYKTAEGVKIEIPEQASDTFKTENIAEGTLVTIKTRRLIRQ